MAELNTKKFGALEYREDSVFLFPRGLPAFEHETEFVPIEDLATAGLVYLQSVRTRELCFVAFPAAAVDPRYQLLVGRDDLAVLGLDTLRQPRPGEEVLVLALLCISGNSPVTANLLAPVVVNLANRRAVQAVRSDGQYSPRHEIGLETAC
jgi:flagellar assembly factor FliW